jgi:hypothetical protein
VVSNTPDGNYDLIYYEALYPLGNGTIIQLDRVIVGISNLVASGYFEVFNWGDNIRDENTNVDTNKLPSDSGCTVGPPECDNRVIPIANLYPGASGPAPSTGILIDVDTAKSAPPPGSYRYLFILSPPSSDAAQVDSVVVTEVKKIPPAPIKSMAIQSADATPSPPANTAPVSSTDAVPSPSANTAPASPTDAAPILPTDTAPNPPVDNVPIQPTDPPPASSADTALTSPADNASIPPAVDAQSSSVENASIQPADNASNPTADNVPIPAATP